MRATMAYILEMICVVFVSAYLLPPAISAIMAVNSSATGNITGSAASDSVAAPVWNAGVVTIFQVLLPILVIITLALALMPAEIKDKVGV